MRIYTSNYSYAKRLREAGILPIAISRYPPRYFKGERYLDLAPTPEMLEMEEEEYMVRFKGILDKLTQQEVYNDLASILNNHNEQNPDSRCEAVALLCFERYTDFCHRHLVAEWFDSVGLWVVEFPERLDGRVNGVLVTNKTEIEL